MAIRKICLKKLASKCIERAHRARPLGSRRLSRVCDDYFSDRLLIIVLHGHPCVHLGFEVCGAAEVLTHALCVGEVGPDRVAGVGLDAAVLIDRRNAWWLALKGLNAGLPAIRVVEGRVSLAPAGAAVAGRDLGGLELATWTRLAALTRVEVYV